MKMPFGKHCGQEISDLPRPYLTWLNDNVELFGELKKEVEATLCGDLLKTDKSYEELLEEINFSWEYKKGGVIMPAHV